MVNLFSTFAYYILEADNKLLKEVNKAIKRWRWKLHQKYELKSVVGEGNYSLKTYGAVLVKR